MKVNRRVLIIAIIMGLITVVALNLYLRSLEKPSLATVSYTNVVVARSTIPAHTRIQEEMLEVKSVPTESVHPEAARKLKEVVEGVSKAEILAGEQVLKPRVYLEGRKATLSYRIPEGMRAISIPAGEVSGVAGFVAPGDRIDILISYSEEDSGTTTYTTFQNIQVLAVGATTAEKDDQEREVVSTLTLAVTPGQAEVLAYAVIKGTFHFTLRSPLDDEVVEPGYYNRRNFDTYKER